MTPTSSAQTYNVAATGMFTGALLAVGRIELLLVIVPPALLANTHECQLSVAAYQARFQKPVVLMAQDLRGAPRYYGPTRLMPVLAAMPFELIPWRQFLYRAPTPWRLPIPPDPPVSPASAAAFALPPGAPRGSAVVPARSPAVGGTPTHFARPIAKHRETLIAPAPGAVRQADRHVDRLADRDFADALANRTHRSLVDTNLVRRDPDRRSHPVVAAMPATAVTASSQSSRDRPPRTMYRIDPDDSAGGARIPLGTPAQGVAVRRRRPGGPTAPMPVADYTDGADGAVGTRGRGGGDPTYDGDGDGLQVEAHDTEASENRTVPVETIDVIEVGQWS